MKKFFSVNVIMGMLITFLAVTSVAYGAPPPDKSPPVARFQGKIKGDRDIRIITPRMNEREKVETMRNIKKRAAAMRNRLMQAAAIEEKKKKVKTVPTGIPSVQ